jgi:GNAT superfamily N-acetyltransferase
VSAQQDGGLPPGERSFTINAAGPADLPDVHALIAGLADYEGLTAICVATQDDLARALFGERRSAEALIARLDGNSPVAAGFALFFHTYSTFLGRRTLWLEDLFVRPEYRRNGLGRQLLKALAALAVERDCGRFEWAVLDWNVSAIDFYESLGAAVLPDWRIARVTGEALPRLAAGGNDSLKRER